MLPGDSSVLEQFIKKFLAIRNEELSDKDILNLVEIIAYQNMSTRIMESLSTIE